MDSERIIKEISEIVENLVVFEDNTKEVRAKVLSEVVGLQSLKGVSGWSFDIDDTPRRGCTFSSTLSLTGKIYHIEVKRTAINEG